MNGSWKPRNQQERPMTVLRTLSLATWSELGASESRRFGSPSSVGKTTSSRGLLTTTKHLHCDCLLITMRDG